MSAPPYPADAVLLAPLAGYTDLPYRHSVRRHGCRFAFTEMIDAGSLVFGNAKTKRFLDRGNDEDWLGVQLIGSDPETLRAAVTIINDGVFDVLDFNLGCPAPKVARKGEGAALALKPDDALRAFEILTRFSRIPVSAKIRVLDMRDPAPTVELASRLENAGAAAVTIHGRVAKSFYSGTVAGLVIAAVRETLNIPVIANGGIIDAASCRALRAATGCQKLMVARGAMGNPWIFAEIAGGNDYIPPTVGQLADELERHVSEMFDYYGESLGSRVARKVILDYLRGRGFPGELKSSVSKLDGRKEFSVFMTTVRQGPSPRYRRWLETNPQAPRRLSPD